MKRQGEMLGPRLAAGSIVGTGLGALFGLTIGDVGAGILLGAMISVGSVLLWHAVGDD
jgi:hypothetical protein